MSNLGVSCMIPWRLMHDTLASHTWPGDVIKYDEMRFGSGGSRGPPLIPWGIYFYSGFRKYAQGCVCTSKS